MKKNPVVHFELPADNLKRMSDFYTHAFGWGTQQMGPEMGNYVVVTTADLDANGRPKTPGAINGGFYSKKDAPPPHAPSVVIAVDDIKEAMKNIEKAGGKLLGQPTMIPGVGQYVSFTDTEGNRLSILQPVMS